jgi:hypothetical protein
MLHIVARKTTERSSSQVGSLPTGSAHQLLLFKIKLAARTTNKLKKQINKKQNRFEPYLFHAVFFTSLVICQSKTIHKCLPNEQKLDRQTYHLTQKKE